MLSDIERNRLASQLGREKHEIAIVLGSGLAEAIPHNSTSTILPYAKVPGLPEPSVPGHCGELISTELNNTPVLIFSGRVHLYEGYSASEICRQVELASALGCKHIILTNASGGISDKMKPGDYLMINDHINLTGQNPLIGISPPAFIDLHNLYSCAHFHELESVLDKSDNQIHCGTLAGLTGPSYETPAEIRYLQKLGAAAVSMSTVNEAIIARYLGMEVTGLSLITNLAAGKSSDDLCHTEVMSQAADSKELFASLLTKLISKISS